MITLDSKDKKILYELDRNSRQSNSEIGRKVGLSKQVVGFRIQRLIDSKVISSFHTVIDISRLGFSVHKNFFRLQNLSKEKESEFIDFFKSNRDIVWCASCDGRYDFAFGTWASNVEYLSKVLKEINNKFGEQIYERQIATILKVDYFPRSYLIENSKRETAEVFYGSVGTKLDIDKIDWKILQELGKSARTPTVEIAEVARLSADAVASRIKKMEKAGLIQQYTLVPNETVYPYLHYKVLISFKHLTDSIDSSFFSFCKSHPNIVLFVRVLSPWDYEIDIEVESVEKFREVLMNLKSQFPSIRDYYTLSLPKVHKYNFCPGIPIQ